MIIDAIASNIVASKFLGLYLTNTCNGLCAFCFKRHEYPRELYISYEDMQIFCDWVWENEIEKISLAGGEPTKHPDFVRLLSLAKRLHLSDLQLITNLMCTDVEKLEAICEIGILANGNFLETLNRKLFLANLKQLLAQKNHVTVSHTVWSLNQKDEPLLECCAELGVENVRLDLSRASILRRNRHVTLETAKPFKDRMMALARKLVSAGVRINFDCPLPVGLLSDEEVEEIKPRRYSLMDPNSHSCGHLYVNADLTISGCPHQVLLEDRLDSFPDYDTLRFHVREAKHRRLVKLHRQHKEIDLMKPVLCEAERFLTGEPLELHAHQGR